MNPYLNLNRNSNVVSYETTDNSIHIVFKSGTYRNYLYDQMRPGKAIVDRMKSLAKQGYGLNAFISSFVKNNYSKKW